MPFAVLHSKHFPDGQANFYGGLRLSVVIASKDAVRIEVKGEPRDNILDSVESRYASYSEIYWWLRSLTEIQLKQFMQDFCARYQFDMQKACRDIAMTWEDISQLATDPLVTIGAHTVDHVTYLLRQKQNCVC